MDLKKKKISRIIPQIINNIYVTLHVIFFYMQLSFIKMSGDKQFIRKKSNSKDL